MKKYKIEFKKIDTYVVDVLADTDQKACVIAKKHFDDIQNTYQEHYYQIGDTNIIISNIFDITNTDDPFNPENKELKKTNWINKIQTKK